MKIYVDDILLGNFSRGISRDFAALKDTHVGYEFIGLKRRENTTDLGMKLSLLKASLTAPRKLNPIPAGSVFFSPHPWGLVSDEHSHSILRVHDLFPIMYPEFFASSKVRLFKKTLNSISNRTILLANSQTTARNIKEICPEYSSQVLVQQCLPLSKRERCADCIGCDSRLDIQYFISVGTVEPRKNYMKIMEVFNEYRSRGGTAELVVIGATGWLNSDVQQRMQNTKHILHLINICDYGVIQLIKGSLALISLSFDEGFNLPAAEARYLGVPTILSDIQINRELHDNYADFVNLKDDSISTRLLKLEDENFNGGTNIRARGWIDGSINWGLACAVEEVLRNHQGFAT